MTDFLPENETILGSAVAAVALAINRLLSSLTPLNAKSSLLEWLNAYLFRSPYSFNITTNLGCYVGSNPLPCCETL